MSEPGSEQFDLSDIELIQDDNESPEQNNIHLAWLGESDAQAQKKYGSLQFSSEALRSSTFLASSNLNREVGGLLVGRRNADGSKSVLAALSAPIDNASQAGQLNFFDGYDSMQEELSRMKQTDSSVEILGWWHSHPPEEGEYGEGVSSWDPVPGGGRTNGDLKVTSLLKENYGVREPETLILQTHRDGRVNLALYRWDSDAQAVVYQNGIQFGSLVEGELGLLPEGDIDYWTPAAGAQTVFPLNPPVDFELDLPEVVNDVNAFDPDTDIEIIDEAEVYVQRQLRAVGISDPDVFISQYTQDHGLGIFEVSREDALQLAANILRRQSEKLVEIVEQNPGFIDNLKNIFRSMTTPKARNDAATVRQIQYMLGDPRLHKYTQALAQVYGKDLNTIINTPSGAYASVLFLQRLDEAQSSVLQSIEITSPEDEVWIPNSMTHDTGSPGFAPIDFDLGLTPAQAQNHDLADEAEVAGLGASYSPEEATLGVEQAGSAVVAQVRQRRDLLNKKRQLEAQLSAFEDPFSDEAIQLSGEMSVVNKNLETLAQILKEKFSEGTSSVFEKVFWDAFVEEDLHKQIRAQQSDFFDLAIGYCLGEKSDNDLIDWYSQTSSALAGVRQTKMTDETLVQLMTQLKQS